VGVKHVRASFMQEKPVKIEITNNLNDQEKSIIDFLKKNVSKEIDSRFLYDSLSKLFAERTVRGAIASLEEKNLISTEKIARGNGSTRIIRLKS